MCMPYMAKCVLFSWHPSACARACVPPPRVRPVPCPAVLALPLFRFFFFFRGFPPFGAAAALSAAALNAPPGRAADEEKKTKGSHSCARACQVPCRPLRVVPPAVLSRRPPEEKNA